MSSSTSRKVPVDVLSHPDIVALVEQGRQTGTVTADALRTATSAAATTPQHLKAVLRFLSEEGVSVVVSAEDSKSPKLVEEDHARDGAGEQASQCHEQVGLHGYLSSFLRPSDAACATPTEFRDGLGAALY